MKTPLGLVPQKNVLIEELTCEQTVKLFYDLKRHVTSWRERSNNIRQLLEDVELWSKRSSKASDLSGGMKRRLQLAIGMAGNSECESLPRLQSLFLMSPFIKDLLVDEVRQFVC